MKTYTTRKIPSSSSSSSSSAGPATIHVPLGRFLVANPVVFRGAKSCKSIAIHFRIDGVLVASPDFRVLAAAPNWLLFDYVVRVSISGGILDDQGSGLWACKKCKGGRCLNGATTLGFTNS
ncbi:hypothetical protein V2J09_013254 [Rumex salicifolius]